MKRDKGYQIESTTLSSNPLRDFTHDLPLKSYYIFNFFLYLGGPPPHPPGSEYTSHIGDQSCLKNYGPQMFL